MGEYVVAFLWSELVSGSLKTCSHTTNVGFCFYNGLKPVATDISSRWDYDCGHERDARASRWDSSFVGMTTSGLLSHTFAKFFLNFFQRVETRCYRYFIPMGLWFGCGYKVWRLSRAGGFRKRGKCADAVRKPSERGENMLTSLWRFPKERKVCWHRQEAFRKGGKCADYVRKLSESAEKMLTPSGRLFVG